MSEKRLNKLRLYAASKDKTVTQIVEDACWQVAQYGDWQFVIDQHCALSYAQYHSSVNSSLPRIHPNAERSTVTVWGFFCFQLKYW